jgi:hypothetical protein
VNRTPVENEKDRRIRQLEQLVQEQTAQLSRTLVQLEQSYDDTLEALGSALDLKDAKAEGHRQRVTALCISIAKAMPVPDTDPRPRRFPSRHRQNGPSGQHSPQTRPVDRRRKKDYAQAL